MHLLAKAHLPALIALSLGSAIAADNTVIRLAIPPQPLASALETLAKQSGLHLFYADALVKGKHCPGLSGNFTAHQAIEKLLAGSGLGYVFTGNNTVAIKLTPADKNKEISATTATMPVVKVLGKASTGEPQEESKNPYVALNSSTAMKMSIPVQQLPFSVKTITKDLIKDQNAITLERALENTNAIASDTNSGWGAKSYAIRGFDLTNRLLVNGVRATDYAEIDPALIDKVEVLKGSAANLYGRTEPGGLINIVTLKPEENFKFSASQGFGSYDLFRTTADVTGSANPNKTILYRMIVANTNSNSYRDTVETNHLTISPSFTFKITPKDEAYLRYEHKSFRDTTDYGQPLLPTAYDQNGNPTSKSILNIGRNVVIGGYGNFNDLNEDNILTRWSHTFTDQWKLNTTLNYYNWGQKGVDGSFGGWNTKPNLYNVYVGNPSNFSGEGGHAEGDLVGKFNTFGIGHNSLLSYEYADRLTTYQEWSCNATNQGYTIDLNNPSYQLLGNFNCGYPNPSNQFGNFTRNQWQAWSAQDMLKLTQKLRILVGFRQDYAYGSQNNLGNYYGTYANSLAETSKIQGRYGISYDVLSNLALFANYSEGFGATNLGTTLYNGNAAKSETSEQKEIGLKAQWLDSKLTTEFAYFDLRKQNYVLGVNQTQLGTTCTAVFYGNTCYIQAGEIGSQGFEFNASGELHQNWQMNFAYTNMDAKFLKGDPTGFSNPTGQKVAGIPKDSGSAWLMYKDPTGWSAGLGSTYVGERPFDAPVYQTNATLTLPSYLRWDAVLGYKYKLNGHNLIAQLSINNISNVNAYQRGWGGSGVIPSEPTNAFGSVKFEF